MTYTPTALPGDAQHPAIAEAPLPRADEKGMLDRGLFAVSAVLALAFVAWGFLSPSGLGSASAGALTWIESNLGWLFVTLGLGVRRLRAVAGGQQVRPHPARAATTRSPSSGPSRGSR